MIKRLIIICLWMISIPIVAQTGQQLGGEDESMLYATTKQVNQFFRRFNGEEDPKGKRLYENDKYYREPKVRKQYLEMLFDQQGFISKDQKADFTKTVLDAKEPQFLDFHQTGWFAELKAVFTNKKGQKENVVLFMEIESQRAGYAWVIKQVYLDRYAQMFSRDTTENRKFIHPMSHELDFMNLHKAFRNNNGIDYAASDFKADHMTLFLAELQNSQLKFETIQSVNFHFFQVEGWYFQITEYNRAGYNNGWLISDLTPIKEEEIPLLKSFIYEQK